jgi:hypothetical protein
MDTTVIIHIYNEEYMLPFWLKHHKNIFNHGIIIDYRSTDNSINICKEICPTWDIITTRNEMFDAKNVDLEVMDIEDKISGIKICLNVTEFLFTLKPLIHYFKEDESLSYAIKVTSPYSVNTYYPENNHELFEDMLNEDVFCHNDRDYRQLHNFGNGAYSRGRHATSNPITNNDIELHIIWTGYYPFNELVLKRKLQIKNNIPESDKKLGIGYQHLFDADTIMSVIKEKADSGWPLKHINPSLYKMLELYLTF